MRISLACLFVITVSCVGDLASESDKIKTCKIILIQQPLKIVKRYK